MATYYNNIDFTGTTLVRVDPQVITNWGNGSPAPSIGADTFSAVWTGLVRPQFTQAYTFYTNSDDGVRLYINGQLVINNWTDHGPTENASSPISLTANQTYTIRLEFYENGGGAVAQLSWSSASVPKAFIPQSALFSGVAPTAPSSLSAVAASGTQINLAWTDNSAIETGFKIERKQGIGGTYSQIALVNPNVTTYMDGALLANTTYYYRVSATNFVSNSIPSNEANATTPVPPLTPSDAHPTTVTTSSIAFAWQDNSNNEDKFSIFRRTGEGSFIFVHDVPANTTTYTDTGLSPGTEYDYHIQAANLGGYTDFAGFTVTTVTLPPASPSAIGSAGQIDVSWSPSLGADSYNVYRGTSPDDEAPEPVASGLIALQFTDYDVVSENTYYYKVTAITTGGESATSAEVSSSPTTDIFLPGDLNRDGHVNGSDLSALMSAMSNVAAYKSLHLVDDNQFGRWPM